MTKIWTASAAPAEEQIDEIAQTLRRGGVVLLPTDTIYGLHALANDARANERIAGMKGRDAAKAFVVIGASAKQLEEIGALLTVAARDAVAQLWPGPLTAIVPLRHAIAASRGAMTIAMRVPALDWLRSLLEITGPLTSTSANVSGDTPASDPKRLSSGLQESLDGILDAGDLHGQPSTIVDFTGDPKVIREGESLFTQKVRKTLRKSL